ncbi:MAG: hypothetical protein ACOVOD_17340 [Rhodoferax sp.]
MFYSAQTNGFYDAEIHEGNIPEDAVEITLEQYQELIDGSKQVRVISAGPDGYPILKDYPELTPEQAQKLLNAKARAYLDKTDWYVIRNVETGVAIPPEVTTKRAEARAAVV